MISPSKEQEDIVQCISNGIDVACDAVAGAGKTTTVLWIAKANPNKHIIQITYNSQLKEEVRKKAKAYSNLEVHTYHSLAVNYYDRLAYEDTKIRSIIKENTAVLKEPKADILVIDEAQDMTLMLFRFIRKFLNDLQNKSITLLILGDRNQSVYEFKDADPRFLTLANIIWKRQMTRKLLQRSYRVTDQIAWFVNNVMLGKPYIVADKVGPPIMYIRDNAYDEVPYIIVPEIVSMINGGLIKPSDIFVLSGSVKGDLAPFKKLENAFVANGIPCYVPISDNSKLDQKVIDGKAVFTTFHQAKGRERAVVIVYGFDSSFFRYFGRDKPEHICPSELYVAVTRSCKHLYLVEHSSTRALPFLKYSEILTNNQFIEYIGEQPTENTITSYNTLPNNVNDKHYASPTELVRFMKEETVAFCTSATECIFEKINIGSNKVAIPSTIKCKNKHHEEVSDLNGLIIPTMWEAKQTACHITTLHNVIQNAEKDTVLTSYCNKIQNPCTSISEYLYLGNVYQAIENKLHYKITQIDRYDWLTEDMVNICHINMNEHINPAVLYEEELGGFNIDNIKIDDFVRQKLGDEYGNIKFLGRLDAIDNTTVWELKCVNDLMLEHKLQLVIYAWMWRMYRQDTDGLRIFKLMNIRTGEILKLNTSSYLIDDIVCALLTDKYGKVVTSSDTVFIEKCYAL